MSVVVDHPEHYQGVYSEVCSNLLMKHLGLSIIDLGMECIDFIEKDDLYSDFLLGNAIKYLWRSGAKGDAQPDLLKALWYLKRWASADRKSWRSWFFGAYSGFPDYRNDIESSIATLILDLENLTK